MSIRMGIIGAGFIGPAHIDAIRRLGFVEAAALAGSNPDNAKKTAAELGIPKAYGSYLELLQDPDIQVVHNCTPNHLHYEINKAIILSGKHVLSEKPLAISSRESAELLHLAKARGVVHAVNFNYRQFPMMKQLSAMIKQDVLGRINLIRGSYLQDWLLYETDYNWRLAPEAGGPSRAIADIGSHWCDTVQYVTGLRIVEVFADLATVMPVRRKAKQQTATYAHRSMGEAEYEDIPIRTEDCANVLIRFEDGTRGAFTVSQVSAGRKNRLSFELSGSKRSAYWNQEEPQKLWIGHREKANEVLLADPSLFVPEARAAIHHPAGHNEGWPDAMKNMMRGFYDFIREGKNPLQDRADFSTFADGHVSMRITDAILASHAAGRWVRVQS
ncbi:putative dehydrogenase [Paenibacillus methanolicus]|uniref:Putative dehydrogenase n=1 Tax=Paenibacillus methanolicus TaxID=582686 RepID=A0A5S5CAZ3_9BACL|nr:putative dehydrogenase [Paenibacillus methanolicus]